MIIIIIFGYYSTHSKNMNKQKCYVSPVECHMRACVWREHDRGMAWTAQSHTYDEIQ